MTSYEFEVAAKNAVVEMLKERGIQTKIDALQLVWFAHLLGNKKCMIWGPVMEDYYAEVTFSQEAMVVYVDLYKKDDHRRLYAHELDLTVHED